MAELAKEFIAERLNSRQSLALLFVCECKRKKTLDNLNFQGGERPPVWVEFVDRFAARLSHLPEAERVYLIGSHLQSVEAVDIYSNAEIDALLDRNRELLASIVRELDGDPRFA